MSAGRTSQSNAAKIVLSSPPENMTNTELCVELNGMLRVLSMIDEIKFECKRGNKSLLNFYECNI